MREMTYTCRADQAWHELDMTEVVIIMYCTVIISYFICRQPDYSMKPPPERGAESLTLHSQT